MLFAAAAGSAPASCQLSVNRAIFRCLLLDLDSDCGGLTSKDRWRTPGCSNLSSTHRYTGNTGNTLLSHTFRTGTTTAWVFISTCPIQISDLKWGRSDLRYKWLPERSLEPDSSSMYIIFVHVTQWIKSCCWLVDMILIYIRWWQLTAAANRDKYLYGYLLHATADVTAVRVLHFVLSSLSCTCPVSGKI